VSRDRSRLGVNEREELHAELLDLLVAEDLDLDRVLVAGDGHALHRERVPGGLAVGSCERERA
jgi:hypothetical protein